MVEPNDNDPVIPHIRSSNFSIHMRILECTKATTNRRWVVNQTHTRAPILYMTRLHPRMKIQRPRRKEKIDPQQCRIPRREKTFSPTRKSPRKKNPSGEQARSLVKLNELRSLYLRKTTRRWKGGLDFNDTLGNARGQKKKKEKKRRQEARVARASRNIIQSADALQEARAAQVGTHYFRILIVCAALLYTLSFTLFFPLGLGRMFLVGVAKGFSPAEAHWRIVVFFKLVK